MGYKDYIPASDGELLGWAKRFGEKIGAMPSRYGVTVEQAAAFHERVSAFHIAMTAAADPATRTRGQIAAKDAARAPMIRMARELGRVIHASPGMTNALRIELGLNPRCTSYKKAGVPAESPVLSVSATKEGRVFRIRLSGQDTHRRGKPANCRAATLLSYVVTTADALPPADLGLWTFVRSSTRNIFDFQVPPTVKGGSRMFFVAFWTNTRAQRGPVCSPVSAFVGGGVSAVATAKLRAA